MIAAAPDQRTAAPPPNYRRYWLSLYRRDVPAAERIVRAAIASWTLSRIYLRLFEPALNLSGTLWARGCIQYADEHFVTHHTLRMMRLVRRAFVPANPTGPLALALGVAQESHLIGLRMVCDHLACANWRTHWLPTHERGTVADVTARLRPAAVLLSVGTPAGVEPAARLVRHLRRRGFPGHIAVGGRAINDDPSLVHHIGATLTAPNGLLLARHLRLPPVPSPGLP